jgi:hypothetical protein
MSEDLMSAQAVSPYVDYFGSSMIFGHFFDKTGAEIFPIIAQPFLFYPDWFLLDYPYQLIRTGPANIAPISLGFSVLWFVIGTIITLNTDTKQFGMMEDWMQLKHVPVSSSYIERTQSKGALGELKATPLVVVNLVYTLIYQFFICALYWHFLIAFLITGIASLGGRIGWNLTNKVISRIALFIMVAPPIGNIIFRSLSLLYE